MLCAWCCKTQPPRIREKTLRGVAEYILSNECTNIVTMAGAGISTAAGIPDFRSPQSGIYSKLREYNLPYPEAVFDIEYFEKNPEPFFRLCREVYPKSKVTPTLTHYFIKLIDDKGLLLRHYTQNIDSLERRAGLREEKLIEAHGSFETSHCTRCGKEYSLQWLEARLFAEKVPRCAACGAVVRPGVVLFGESLPRRFFAHVRADLARCDLLLAMGSSLGVQPFASLPRLVGRRCPRVVINRVPPSARGFKFRAAASRDVAWFGACDDGCSALAQHLDWSKDLAQLMKKA